MGNYPVSQHPFSELVRGVSPDDEVGDGFVDCVHQDRDQQVEACCRGRIMKGHTYGRDR